MDTLGVLLCLDTNLLGQALHMPPCLKILLPGSTKPEEGLGNQPPPCHSGHLSENLTKFLWI